MAPSASIHHMGALGQLNTALAGRYTIDRVLGRGGMATVYLAVDIKHDRRVALKVLDPELGAVLGPDRFLAEIRTTANLQHPHLLPLFDSGAADGLLFYVMPFVEGETLRHRLDREKQLPVDEAVRIATAVASALDYAHSRGVIHRDLKPENILMQAGQPVVADFGIALAVSRAGGARVTQTGISLGTPQYMSPEQATGDRDIDGRTDIYSLAAVLYEMLAGDPPHTASTAQAIVAKVLTERPPDVRTRRPNVPDHVAAAVECALEKLPADRFTNARAFADALEGRTSALPARKRVPTRRALASPLPWVALSAAALALAGWSWTHRGSSASAARSEPVFATLMPPTGTRFGFGGSTFSISPDGGRVALVAFGGDARQGTLFIRALSSLATTRLAGTVGALYPFWSPDGSSLGFFADGQLKTIELASGTVRSLCPAAFRGGATWGKGDVILFTSEVGGPLRRVSPTGGPCTPLSITNYTATSESRPFFLPDGTHFIIQTRDTLFLGDIREDSIVALREAPATTPVFAAPDFLLFRANGDDAQGEELYAQRIDVAGRRLLGQPRRILDRVTNPGGSTAVSASANGVLIAQGPGFAPHRMLVSVSRDGSVDSTVLSPDVWSFRPTHAGSRIALGGWSAYLYDVARRANSRVAVETDSGRQTYVNPVWSPRDSMAAYSRTYNRRGVGLFDPRTGQARNLFASPNSARGVVATDWSPDGRYLTFTLGAGGGVPRDEAWVYEFANGASRRLFEDRGSVQEVRFSPDGRWLAYQSDDGDGADVYIRPFSASGSAVRVSTNGGRAPRWSADGRALFYAAPDGRVLEVDVRSANDLTLSAPRAAIAAAPLGQSAYRSFEPSADGQRFWFLFATGDSPTLTLVLNWWALAGERR